MKTHMAVVVVVSVLGGCAKQSPPPATEVLMSEVDVGTRTPDYEVVSPTELKLSPGVKIKVLEGDRGQNNGFVLLKDNGGLGGFMACGCVGDENNCKTENDNPDHAGCSGSCRSSEGLAKPCQLETVIGPPKNPFAIKFVGRSANN